MHNPYFLTTNLNARVIYNLETKSPEKEPTEELPLVMMESPSSHVINNGHNRKIPKQLVTH